MKNPGLVLFGTLGAILIGVFAPLIVYFVDKGDLEPHERAAVTALLNFEISLFIVCIIINFIPLIGKLLTLALCVLSIVYSVLAFIAAKENKPFKAPTVYPFLK